MKKLWIVLLSLFLLTGCGQKPETPIPFRPVSHAAGTQ